ncbi:MAG TPA: hypothetical protein VMV22_13585 [Acidimicrobiales bacterium]|nr:hypothetical protein [Acidimicrobiales bacterium]
MAVGAQFDFEGATLADYDRSIARLGFLLGGPAPRGQIFHWVTQTDTGIRVTDVWESREVLERFVQERLAPVLEEGGVATPVIQFFEVHNYFAAGKRRG